MDDFLSIEDICALTGANGNQVRATLHHFQNKKIADAVLVQGRTMWFLTGEDERQRTIDEKVPEEPGTRHRKRGYTRRKNPDPT